MVKTFACCHRKFDPVYTKTKHQIFFTVYHYCIDIYDEVSISYFSFDYILTVKKENVLVSLRCHLPNGKNIFVGDSAPKNSMDRKHAEMVCFT